MSRRGESIYKRADGRWEARYIHHYEDGKAKYRYIYGKTYAEVKQKRLQEQSMPENMKPPQFKQTATFDKLAALWLLEVKTYVKESTYTRYFRIVTKYLQPLLGETNLAKMGMESLSQLPEKLLAHGGVNGDSLSPKTVSDILCVLKTILKYGQKRGYPCPDISDIKYPQKSGRKMPILNDETRQRIEQILLDSEDEFSLGILFTLFTGVRIGELCGLKWDDIDLLNNIVHIRRTVSRIANLDPLSAQKTKVVISAPKTESSVRTIPLPKFLANHLAKFRRPPGIYLLTGTRKPTEPHQYYMRYKRFLRQNGIDGMTFHSLRHTFATRCVELGFDTKALSEILGHNNISTTLAVYVHPTLQQKRIQMERLTPAGYL